MPRNRKSKQGDGSPAASPSSPQAPEEAEVQRAAPPQPPMTLLLRTKDKIELRRCVADGAEGGYNAASAIDGVSGGDFSECEPVFSPSAPTFACSNGRQVLIMSSETCAPVAVIEERGVTHIEYSPRGNMLVTYRMQDAKVANDTNMAFFHITPETAPGYELRLRCGQSTWPAVWWTRDESHLIRRAQGHLMQVHDGQLQKTEHLASVDLQTPRTKEPRFATALSDLPFVAVFVPQLKNAMAHCKIYRLPNVKDELLQRTFGAADDAQLRWSPHLNAMLAFTWAEGDKSGGSYYGRSSLTVMSMKDRECYSVVLGKDDGIHDAQWSPNTEEFIVVHGQMPRNKATLFNSQAQALYSFGESPRNYVQWSLDGRMFLLGGNGNLAGETQFYHREAVNKQRQGDGKLGYYSEKTSMTIWTPDSRAVVSAIVFSRLRLDNKITFWKHTGERSYHERFDQLFTAAFVPVPPKAFQARPPSPIKVSQETTKPTAYRAPGAASAAAAMLARNPGSAVGGAAKPTAAGPVGATVVVQKKKGKR